MSPWRMDSAHYGDGHGEGNHGWAGPKTPSIHACRSADGFSELQRCKLLHYY